MIDNHPELWLENFPKPDAHSHKYTRGQTMVIGGYPVMGASRLSAYAAARMGSGLTTLLVPDSAFALYASAMTSIMVKPYADDADFQRFIDDKRLNSFLIGPGTGVNQQTRHQVLCLLKTKRATVLDADALTVFADDVTTLSHAIQHHCVLTPHQGEFERLFKLGNDRVLSVQQAAAQSGAIIVLKGAQTIIAAPDGQAIINRDAPATLATGGSGDVLAGMIAGLLAQGMPAFDAACAAVWIHGEAAKRFGYGLIAEDLPLLIPKVLNQLLSE